MPNYKLIYFNSRGRAEVTRYLFAAAGVEYEDVRVTGEEWAKIKADCKSPFGQLPVLEVDGNTFYQSQAIAGYVARELGLHGKTNEEEYRIYVVQGAFTDLIQKLGSAEAEKDPEKKAEIQKDVFENYIPKWLSSMEEVFQQVNGDYFAGDRLTVGDFYFFHACEYLKGINQQALDKLPGLNGLFDRIVEMPKIAAWRSKRPVTMF
ncbi:Hematopoietic prostaglandin D synthase [Trichoplax sp. H2]|uniref:Uncharacterized protein n=1 Tax=Trichoplax adhaerens TaxID=10228 RepID=B3RTI7_TRIAD|nr:expressed hypothetical protein [Trichoplax adhaerens]EDV26141.1 expressed hypothetical protein [Trichoplax adhaerens]RDD40830.1 Hematopoietic prostaglandin D synthase [Trichoplax sp. H2]|eukprot:XP_002112174.1 expressed hypothetical protein [Trichoplax adhaerens]